MITSILLTLTTHTTAFDHVPYAGELAAVCTEHAANLVCEQLELVLFEQQKHVDMEDQESSKSYMSSCWSEHVKYFYKKVSECDVPKPDREGL